MIAPPKLEQIVPLGIKNKQAMRTTYPSANAQKNAKYISGLLQVYHRLVGSDLGLVLKYYAATGDELRVALHEVFF